MTATADDVVAVFVVRHARAMLRSKVVRRAIGLGVEPDEAMVSRVADELFPECAPALLDHEPTLSHASGLPIDDVISNRILFHETFQG